MVIERTASEFIIRFPFTTDSERMQDIIDYLRYKELTANYCVAQSEVDNLAKAINRKWWEENQAKFE
jgi:pyruvate/2-oxoacid:ferredoxin oxidoreductase alpha subunit